MYIFGRGRYRIPFGASAMPLWKRRIFGPYKFFSQMSSGVRVIRGRRHLMRVPGVGDLETKETYTIGRHHTSLSYLFPLPSTCLNTSFLSPPGRTGKATNYVIRCAHPRSGANTHTHQYFFIFFRSANSHEETGTPTEKKVTRAARMCKEAKGKKGPRLSHHGRNLSYPGQQGLTQHS
jgi:hypothetical protein